ASVSISESSARTLSASASSSRRRAARCIRAARDWRRLCSRRESRFSLISGESYHKYLAVAVQNVGGEGAQRVAIFGVGESVECGARVGSVFISPSASFLEGAG